MKTKNVIVIEDGTIIGGLGTAIEELIVEENVNNAESAYEKELYSLALSYIDTALQYDPDDEDISQRKEEYTALLVEQLKTSAADKSAEQNYEKAVELIKEALTYYADDEELLALLDTYEELLSAQIAEKEAAEIAAASLYTGKVLNTNHAEVTVKNIDIGNMLVETDSPYLAPEEKRGEKNTSLNLKYIIGKIADMLDMDEEGVMEITTENARKLFEI